MNARQIGSRFLAITDCYYLQKKPEFKWFPGKGQYKLSNQQNTMFTYVAEYNNNPPLSLSLSLSLLSLSPLLSSQQNTMLVQVPEQ